MIILGIDPGLATVGYGVIEASGAARFHVAHGVVRTPPGMPAPERLKLVDDGIAAVLKRYHPELVAVEELFFSSNVSTAISVAEARGVLLLAAGRAGCRVVEYSPNRVKQAVTASGRAEKPAMMEMVRVLLNLESVPRPDDAADALAIALCAAQEPRWQAAFPASARR